MDKKNIKLAWLFPSTLYLHGERGNILAFEKIAQNNDINLTVDTIELNNSFNPLDYDIIYMPAGELVQAQSVITKLEPVKKELKQFIKEGRPLIVTGNSITYFGKNIKRLDKTFQGLGILDFESIENKEVYGDDINFCTNYNQKDLEILGNQIQMCDIKLNSEEPFGTLLYGYGNTGKDKNEGIRKNNSFFTNTLGPLFVLNPWLTQEVINIALENNKLSAIQKQSEYKLEKQSFNSKKDYIKNKKTNLTNTK